MLKIKIRNAWQCPKKTYSDFDSTYFYALVINQNKSAVAAGKGMLTVVLS